jgi:hypothetical protein
MDRAYVTASKAVTYLNTTMQPSTIMNMVASLALNLIKVIVSSSCKILLVIFGLLLLTAVLHAL